MGWRAAIRHAIGQADVKTSASELEICAKPDHEADIAGFAGMEKQKIPPGFAGVCTRVCVSRHPGLHNLLLSRGCKIQTHSNYLPFAMTPGLGLK